MSGKKEKKIKNDKSLLYNLPTHKFVRKNQKLFIVSRRKRKRKRKKRKRKFERKCNRPKDPSFYRSTYRASPNFFPSQIYFPATVANIDRKFITDRNHAGTFYYLKFIDIPPEFHRVLQL